MIPQSNDDGFDDILVSDPYVNVPDELKNNRHWLVYRMESSGNGHKTKIPYDPTTKKKANNPDFGVTFDAARSAEKEFSGLGFYVEPPYTVIDIDNCIDQNGLVADYAAQIVREVNSYAEASPSGTGIHLWLRGKKPGDKCRKGIEIYGTKRFLTITGFHVPGTPKEIREVDITGIYNRMLAGDYENQESAIPAIIPSVSAPKLSAEIKSSGKVLTTKLQLFMFGQIVSTKPFVVADEYQNSIQFPSQSEADLSLATLLAFKYEGDVAKIDGDFRVSTLYREKWDRQDYRDATIKQAVSFYYKTKTLEAPPKSASQTSVENNDEEEFIEVEQKLPEFPIFTGALADLCSAMSPDIPYPYKFVSGITHLGLIRSGMDTFEVEPHIQPRFYSALVGPPGSGKTAAINEISKIIRMLSPNYRVFSSIDSGPALVDAFQEQTRENMLKATPEENLTDAVSAKILLSPDELKGIFEKSKITLSSRNTMLDELLKLYEGNTTGNRVRGAKIKIHIENAHLGLLGGATEGGYSAMWAGTGGASDGLQSRIIPIGIESRKMPSMQRSPNAEALTSAIQRLTDQIKMPGEKYVLDDEAFEMYDAWWRVKDQSRPSETRIDGIVKRLLIVLARTNDIDVIDSELVQQAIDFGDFVIACREKFNPLDSSTWVQMQENVIIAAYQKHIQMSQNKCRRLVHPERRPGGIGPFLQAFKNLVQAGILIRVTGTQRSDVFRLSL